ncbi:MAG: ATP-binding protein [Candidatus Aenigmatarchaeota archaeon]
MYEIVVGRTPKDFEKFGTDCTGYLGKHIVGKGDEAHLTNKVLIDFLRPHCILIAGKRGSGKSYSGGIIAEEMALLPKEFAQNLSSVMIDTMGIYWSMKYPNDAQEIELEGWGLKPRGLKDEVKVYVPFKQKKEFEEAGIPVDFGISIPPREFNAEDWTLAFDLPPTNPIAIALQKTVNYLQNSGENYNIDDMITRIKDDRLIDTHVKSSLENMLTIADQWGVFGEEGVKIEDIVKPCSINVFDVSRLRATEAWSVRNLLVALICRKIYYQRVIARKQEELAKMGEIKLEKRYPMVWLIIDEAHQFIPAEGMTVSSRPILDIIKQGREPGISFVPMTQMPNKVHQEVISQCDMVISHRLTSKNDLQSLQAVMQNYLIEDLTKSIDSLPKWKGTAIVLDDNSERIYEVQIRPRFSWHAGESAIAKIG